MRMFLSQPSRGGLSFQFLYHQSILLLWSAHRPRGEASQSPCPAGCLLVCFSWPQLAPIVNWCLLFPVWGSHTLGARLLWNVGLHFSGANAQEHVVGSRVVACSVWQKSVATFCSRTAVPLGILAAVDGGPLPRHPTSIRPCRSFSSAVLIGVQREEPRSQAKTRTSSRALGVEAAGRHTGQRNPKRLPPHRHPRGVRLLAFDLDARIAGSEPLMAPA